MLRIKTETEKVFTWQAFVEFFDVFCFQSLKVRENNELSYLSKNSFETEKQLGVFVLEKKPTKRNNFWSIKFSWLAMCIGCSFWDCFICTDVWLSHLSCALLCCVSLPAGEPPAEAQAPAAGGGCVGQHVPLQRRGRAAGALHGGRLHGHGGLWELWAQIQGNCSWPRSSGVIAQPVCSSGKSVPAVSLAKEYYSFPQGNKDISLFPATWKIILVKGQETLHISAGEYSI